MARAALPQEVLGDALAAAIDGRRVRTALFTTFSFDPGFFELNILPLLFDRSFSQVEKVKRIQLEDALRTLEEIAVYYDRSALSQDALPAQLDFRRIDVRRKTGVFHPKLVLLLVENQSPWEEESESGKEQPLLSLIVGTLSANLTRSGWWENVETGHFEEVKDQELDGSPCSFRRDLLQLIGQLRRTAAEGETHNALDRIHRFLLRRASRRSFARHSAGGRYRTRLFFGQADLPSWFEELGLDRHGLNLEIVSPYFDRRDASTLVSLIEAVKPKERRVYLPRDHEGTAAVTEELYEDIGRYACWSDLPRYLLRPGARASAEKAPPRYVHAKLYRLWRRGGPEVTLAGSVNLSASGHSHYGAGNLETAFLVDIAGDRRSWQWWLTPVEHEPEYFFTECEEEEEAEGAQEVCVDISLRYDWSREKLEYRIDGTADGPLEICEPSGRALFHISDPSEGAWCDCGQRAAVEIRQLLPSTSFVQVRHARGVWCILIREEGMSHRPSLLKTLTPEEILMYWSLLSPEQQEAFIQEKLAGGETLEGLPVGQSNRYVAHDTVFDRFSGVYHAFGRLWRYVDDAIENGRTREAEARLLGAKYDSLPVLLQETLQQPNRDSVMCYLTFLCAEQLRRRVSKRHPDFWRKHRRDAKHLNRLLRQTSRLRTTLPLPHEEQHGEFLDWYERIFLRPIDELEAVK
jgi:hypothetical protein